MEFTFKRHEIVVPSPPFAPHTVTLSNNDMIMPPFYTGFLYFFSRPARPPESETLTLSLARVLAAFPPAAGRLKPRSDGFGVDVECCNQGAVFVEAHAKSATLDQLLSTGKGDVHGGMFQPSPLWTSLAPNPYNEEYSDKPLLLAQLTRLACGGVTVTVQLHHLVADGAAMSHLVASWAELARGHPITAPPHLDRDCMQARASPRLSFEHPAYIVHKTVPRSSSSSAMGDPPPPMTSRIFEFLPQDIAKLKERACANEKGGASEFTGFQALGAHIWKHVTKARSMERSQVTRLGWAVDGRKRFTPPLPKNYFGNVNFYGYAAARAADLLDSKSGTDAAALIKRGTQCMTDEYMRSVLDLVAAQASPALVVPSFQGAADWAITSWVHFPEYDADWGWGRPVFFALPTYALSLAILLPHPSGHGVNAFIGMLQPHMHALLSDSEFYPVR